MEAQPDSVRSVAIDRIAPKRPISGQMPLTLIAMFPRLTTLTARGALVLALAGGVTACGSVGTPTAGVGGTSTSTTQGATSSPPTGSAAPTTPAAPTPSRAPAGWPSCQRLWRGGQRIPARYQGCSLHGNAVHAQLFGCSFARRMTTYHDRYYGVLGGPVIDAHGPLEKSKRYRHNYALCTG